MSQALEDRTQNDRVEELRSWICEVIGARAAEIDERQALPADLLDAIVRKRLLAACVPVAHGGDGLDARSIGVLCEALGRTSGSVLSLFTVHTMVSSAISRWGTAAQRDQWLPDLAKATTIAALTLSEPDAGSDVNGVRTTLQRDGDSIVVSGVKTWASFGQLADLFLLSGTCDGQLATILVTRETPGVKITPILGMFGFRGGMLARIEFSNCRVPAANILGRPGLGLSQIVGSVLDHGRFCIAWGGAGLARASLQAAVEYADGREQFGQPLAAHALVQQMITQMMVDARAARLLCEEASRARDARRPDMISKTTAAKYFAARAAEHCAGAALQIHGANGLTEHWPVSRYVREAKVLNIIEGSTQIQQMLVAPNANQWLAQWDD